ncbi:MAG: ChuX/HutX family heme-like substrate-binding protein [Myxococcota bacterium]
MVKSEGLRERWIALRAKEPNMRIRDAAESLGVREGHLVATQRGETAELLRVESWGDLIKELGTLGRAMGLTRNEQVVIEKHGRYVNVEASEHMGMVLDEGIDLRLFFSRWAHAFSVRSESKKGPLRSIQIFDSSGNAIHKVYVFQDGEVEAFDSWVEERTSDESIKFAEPEHSDEVAERPDGEVDVAALRNSWANLGSTHDFYPMLAKHSVTRMQAMRLAGAEFAYRVDPQSYASLIETLAQDGLPFMAFVGNPGCIQIHSGIAKKIVKMDKWFNIFDPDFNLHVRSDQIEDCWVSRKPTHEHGDIWSLEAFSGDSQNVLSLFGLRKRDNPQSPEWMARFEKHVRTLS